MRIGLHNGGIVDRWYIITSWIVAKTILRKQTLRLAQGSVFKGQRKRSTGEMKAAGSGGCENEIRGDF
jgi:hypothetical protein